MDDDSESTLVDPSDTANPADAKDGGVGWMPAIVASTLIFGMVIFIMCSVMTWLLFTKRTELAIRTLRENYIPVVEQSLMPPEEKVATLKEFETLAKELERGTYEDWQAAGAMTRLARLPVFIYWGDLAAIESFIQKHKDDFDGDAIKQISRLRRAAQNNKATAFDFDYAMEPVYVSDKSIRGQRLRDPYSMDQVRRMIGRCKEIADRHQVEDRRYEEIWIDKIVKKQIDTGLRKGTM